MRKPLPLIVLVCSAVAFAFGLFQLLRLRLETGDVYPEYSSLRSDPLGTMALCESLQGMPELSVTRDFSANNQLPAGRDTTYLHSGARTFQWQWLDESEIKEIEGFVTSGGRLAISFFPESTRPFRWFDDPENETGEPGKKESGKKTKSSRPTKKQKKLSDQARKILRRFSLKERWGLEFGFLPLAAGTQSHAGSERAAIQSDLPLPETVEWHSSIVFTNLPPAWSVVYARGTNPVVVERKFGAGTIVMASDSYFLSNEAMLKERHADLLTWWIGPNKKIVFDEAHFGIVETSGVATLIREYRLHWIIAGLLVLAGLFIWKNVSSFVPAYAEESRPDFVPGKDAAAGFVNLLRRNVPAREVLDVCFDEWKKSFTRGGRIDSDRQDRVWALLAAENARPKHHRDPVAVYREICAVLKANARSE